METLKLPYNAGNKMSFYNFRKPAPSKSMETISMNTDDRWDATQRGRPTAASLLRAPLHKGRLKSAVERIRITEVLLTRAIVRVLIDIHGVRGPGFYQYRNTRRYYELSRYCLHRSPASVWVKPRNRLLLCDENDSDVLQPIFNRIELACVAICIHCGDTSARDT